MIERDRVVSVCVAFFAIGATGLAFYCRASIRRLYNFIRLFDKNCIVRNFRDNNGGRLLNLGLPYRVIHANLREVAGFEKSSGPPLTLPQSFEFRGATVNTEEWLEETWTTGLLVLKVNDIQRAQVLLERYHLGNDQDSRAMSWSVGKSVVSALFGVACAEGVIGDIGIQTVTDHVPQLKGTAYDGVLLKHVLQMSSGLHFDEAYSDPASDINMMGYYLACGWSIEQFVRRLKKRDHEPGTFHHYVSMDAQVLGLVLTAALRTRGHTLSSYLEAKIWSKGGFQADATWWLDNDATQMELAIGSLGITTRDSARFGWLYLNGGLSPSSGERLIPEQWIHDSTHADGPHLQPGPNTRAGADSQYFGYGFQWWLCPCDDDPIQAAGDYMAIGIYNQFIYVSPHDKIVIVKNSANADYGDSEDADREGEEKALMAFRAIAAQVRHLKTE